jgi:hypothetical protein
LARPLGARYIQGLLFWKLHALADAAIGGFGVQIGQFEILNQRVLGLIPVRPPDKDALAWESY